MPLEPKSGTSKYVEPGDTATATVYPAQVYVQLGAARYEFLTGGSAAGCGAAAAIPEAFA